MTRAPGSRVDASPTLGFVSNDHQSSPIADSDRPRRWEYPALIALGCAVVVVLLLTVFLTDSTSSGTSEQDAARVGEVQSLLDSWAQAQRSDDPAALAQFVDKAAAPGVLEAQIRRATAAGALNFSDWAYEVSPGTLVEGARTGAPDGDVTLWGAQVVFRYQLDGVDASPTRKAVSMTFAERDGEWFVFADGSIVDLVGAGLNADSITEQSWHGPWDFGPLATATDSGTDSIVIGHPGQQAFVDALAADLDGAVANTTQLWGDWPEQVVVMVAGSAQEFTAMVGSQHDGSSIAAVSVADAVREGTTEVSGQRIIFSPAAASRLTDSTRRAVLRHELMHIAARSQTRDGSPMWVLEGYAEYAGNRKADRAMSEIAPTLAAAVRSGQAPTQFPDDSRFGGVPIVSSLAYESAWSINAYVAERFGEPALTELFRSLAVGSLTSAEIDRRIGEVLGVSAEDLRAGWADWLHRRLG